MPAAPPLDDVRARVNRFYEELPFNVNQSPAEAARLIRAGNTVRQSYPALHSLLQRRRGQRVLDLGCGAGWFANTLAAHYGAEIHGVDLCDHALGFARGVCAELGVSNRVTFHQRDLFALTAASLGGAPFDIVNSLGVLHHTHDCRAALLRVLPLVGPGGFLHLGLYHLHGRRPFLEMFADLRSCLDADRTDVEWQRLEAAAFAQFRRLYPPTVTDETLLRSWFRDQVLHPHETQHTVREVYDWLNGADFDCVTTSLAKFEPVNDWPAVFRAEEQLAEVSYRKNVVDSTYYPGFFVVLARRRLASA